MPSPLLATVSRMPRRPAMSRRSRTGPFVAAGVVGLVADEEVGDLESGLVHLDGVALPRGEDDDGLVDVLADAGLVLPGAHGLDEAQVVGAGRRVGAMMGGPMRSRMSGRAW